MEHIARRYEFGPFLLNPAEGTLLSAGEPVTLAPKPFAVLRVLVERHGHVVRTSELMASIWPDTAVEESNLTVSISVLRKALARTQPRSHYIQTVPKHGYRFSEEVREIVSRDSDSAPPVHGLVQSRYPATRHFAGRDRELATLRNALLSAADGTPNFVAVGGEPGIGKTALIEEALERTQGGFLLARGGCREHLGSVDTFLPILEALDSLIGKHEHFAGVLKDCAPTWYAESQTSGTCPFPAVHERDTAASDRLQGELLLFLREVTHVAPLVFFVDDLHWSDASTIAMLEFLAGRFAGESLRILLVTAYRPSELVADPRPYVALERRLQTHARCTRILLDLLSRGDIEHYVSARFPRNRFSVEFLDAIHRRTDGNPLFMVDLLGDLTRRGVLTEHDEAWEVARPELFDSQCDPPASVRAMVEHTIRQLSAPDHLLLSAAAIQGTEFDVDMLARSVADEPTGIHQRLHTLSTAQRIVRPASARGTGEDSTSVRFAFIHALYGEALRSALSPTRKALLSAAVARAILERHRHHVSHVASRLTLLFEAARDPAQAAQYALVAAQNAVRISGHREAIELAQRGLRLLEAVPSGPERTHREMMLLLTLAASRGVIEGYGTPEMRGLYRRAKDLCRRGGNQLPLVPVLIGLWSSHAINGEFGPADEFAQELLAISEQSDAPGLQPRGHLLHGSALAHLGRLHEGCAELERARSAYGLFPDPCPFILDAGVHTLCELAEYLCILGWLDRGQQTVEEALALSGRLGDPYNITFAHVFAAIIHRRRGEPAEAARRADSALAYASQHGISDGLMFAAAVRGWASCRSGAIPEGVAFIERALAANRADIAPVPLLAIVAESYVLAGRAAEATAAVDLAIAKGERDSDRFCLPELYRIRGESVLLGRTAAGPREAEEHFTQAVELARAHKSKLFELLATMRLCGLRQGSHRRTVCHALTTLYDSFTEGLHAGELLEARRLLDRFS